MSGFDWYDYEHVYTYRSREEFQNVFEIKICNCFGFAIIFAIVTYLLKNIKPGTEDDIDSTERGH